MLLLLLFYAKLYLPKKKFRSAKVKRAYGFVEAKRNQLSRYNNLNKIFIHKLITSALNSTYLRNDRNFVSRISFQLSVKKKKGSHLNSGIPDLGKEKGIFRSRLHCLQQLIQCLICCTRV